MAELQGEKIDIVPWSDDFATFVVNALQPADVTKVVLDEEKHRLDVVVPEDQLSLAIGRRGQNVRLAAQLTGWDIDIMTEAEEQARRAEEFKKRSGLFMEALDVDEVIAHLLVAEGFITIEEIIDTPVAELARIDGFDPDIAAELQSRATSWLESKRVELETKRQELGIQDDLMTFEGLTTDMILKLAESGVKSKDDLADLAGDELQEILGEGVMNNNDANELIMRARAHWFDNNNDNGPEGVPSTASAS